VNERQYKKGMEALAQLVEDVREAQSPTEELALSLRCVGRFQQLGLTEQDVRRLQSDYDKGRRPNEEGVNLHTDEE
jgi:hypothetical protein